MAKSPDNKSADKSSANSISNDSALIRELALLLDETSLTEIEIERAGLRVRVARNITVTAAMPAGYQSAPAMSGASVTPAAVADLAKHPGMVPSPMWRSCAPPPRRISASRPTAGNPTTKAN